MSRKIKFRDKIDYIDIKKLKAYEKNNKRHSEEQINLLMENIRKFGFTTPLLINNDNLIIAGHGRLEAGKKLGLKKLPIIRIDDLTEEEERLLRLADNKLTELGDWDLNNINKELQELYDLEADIGLTGFDLDSLIQENTEEQEIEEARSKLEERFVIPPFTIFDSRKGYWQERKRNWLKLIQDKGETREDTLGFNSLVEGDKYQTGNLGTVSILDPVLAEVVLKWFNTERGLAIDPFAGDSVFGFVAGYLGYKFIGIELREEQARLNQERINKFKLDAKYICDDGQNILKHIKPNSADFLFSCPPYFDLEVYSELENDASNQESYDDFLKIIDNALTGGIKTLKNNRFAVIVMSNVRDKKKGFYYNIVDDVKKIFEREGCYLYNDAILINVVGTGSIRADRQFNSLRKLVRMHQEVLVFYKGDTNKINEIFKRFEVERKTIERHEHILIFFKGIPETIKENFKKLDYSEELLFIENN